MRGLGMGNLGAVCNFERALPASDSAEDAAATARYDAVYNRFFLSGLFHGRYPDALMEAFAPHLPAGWQTMEPGGIDAFNKDLQDRVNADGTIYLTHTRLHGKHTLRLAVGQTGTRREDVLKAWEVLNRLAG